MNIPGNLVVDLGIDVKEVYGFVDLEGKGKHQHNEVKQIEAEIGGHAHQLFDEST